MVSELRLKIELVSQLPNSVVTVSLSREKSERGKGK